MTGRIPHDFRRTAVFDSYNIVSAGDLEEAARRVDERIATRTTTILTTYSLQTEEHPTLAQ